MKRLGIMFLAALLVFAFMAGMTVAAFAKEAPEEEAPAAEAPAEEAAEPTPAPVLAINPLTGEKAEEGATAKRPFAVMINNISVAQPQVGIGQADMIWELMDEGGITRCMAFFTNLEDVDVVGSIRSARWYNVSVAQAFDAIFVHAGGSDEAMAYIDYDHISNVNALLHEGTDAFYRDPDRQSHGTEHSLFGHGAAIVQMAEDIGYDMEHDEYYDGTYGLTFAKKASNQCQKVASEIHITYAGGKTTDFIYDPETKMYTMKQFGEVYTDNGGDPVQFKNILILEAKTSLQEDGLHLTIKLEKGNDGYFCCGGKYMGIKWLRDGYEDTFHFYSKRGTPLKLGIGKTFVAVQQEGDYVGTTEFIE